jgi:peptidoglycan/xylan/chitin deacetylase (PgdA/CDA1 family)
MSWLDAVRTALEAADRPCTVFFRDDDAGWGDERLYALLDVFDRHALPVDLAVIPAALDAPLQRALTLRARSAPVRLHQHGYAHRNHETVGRKCEFGPAREAHARADDIRAGYRVLTDAFGDLLDPVFTPPWNRCAPDTGPMLVEIGLEVLSRDATAPPLHHPGLAEIPITVDWFAHRRGVRLTREELGSRIADGVRSGRPVGVMLHHAVTDDAELADVEALLALVAGHPRVVPTGLAAAGALLPASS